MDNPLVTVYIPTQNRPLLLARALKSVKQQTYAPIEIIVVDDGSQNDLMAENKKICSNFDNAQYIYLEQSVGASAARNIAIFTANGEFISGLDDDDEFLPHRIEHFVKAWQTRPNISLLASGYIFILPGGQTLKSGRKAMSVNENRVKHINDLGNQIFTKTAYLKNIGGFDPNLIACQDYDVWIRLISQYGAGYRLAMQNYVVHQEHEFARISTFSKRLHGHQQLINKFRKNMTSSQQRSQHFFCALYGGEKNILKLIQLSGWRHCGVLAKMLLARWLSKSQ